MMENEEIKNISEKKRFLEIISVFKSHNFLTDITPVKLRETFEELGPSFIKIGQILSNRPDMIPYEYVNELSKLRFDVKPMDYNEILDVLEKELDKTQFPIFKSIDKEILGSASIAQVHRAILKDGREVVIKVQRPNIEDIMVTDINLSRKIFKMFNIEKIFNNVFSVDDILNELLSASLEEMDFIMEGQHIEEFNRINSEISYVKVPRVVKEYSTKKVLIMEYIPGFYIHDRENLIKNGYDMDMIGHKLCEHFIYQALDTGYFHADPHPNNLIISNGKLAYIDFGMMGRISSRNKNLLKDVMFAISNNQINEVVRLMMILCDAKNDVNQEKLIEEMTLLVDENVNVGICDINITRFCTKMIKICVTNGFKMPKDVTMLIRGSAVLEGTLALISPKINLMSVFKSRIEEIKMKQFFNKENLKKEGYQTLNALLQLNKLPSDLHTFLDSTNRGHTKFNFNLVDNNKYMSRFEKMVQNIIICALDVAFIIATALMGTSELITKEKMTLFYVFLGCSIFTTLWLILKMFIDKIKSKK